MGLLLMIVQLYFLAASEFTSFTGECCWLFMFFYNVLLKSFIKSCPMVAYFTYTHGPFVHCLHAFLQTIFFGAKVVALPTTVGFGLMGLFLMFVQVYILAASEVTSFTGECCWLFMFFYNVLLNSSITPCLMLAYFTHKHGPLVHCLQVTGSQIWSSQASSQVTWSQILWN